MSAWPTRKPRTLACVATVGGVAVAMALAACGPGMSGKYAEVDGLGALEFKGRKVYVTTALGTTFVAEYEVDGDRVIIKGAGGSQVYTRAGDRLDGGLGMKFVKQ